MQSCSGARGITVLSRRCSNKAGVGVIRPLPLILVHSRFNKESRMLQVSSSRQYRQFPDEQKLLTGSWHLAGTRPTRLHDWTPASRLGAGPEEKRGQGWLDDSFCCAFRSRSHSSLSEVSCGLRIRAPVLPRSIIGPVDTLCDIAVLRSTQPCQPLHRLD